MLETYPIIAKNIAFSAGFKTIISDISLVLKKTEFVGMIGGSGSGKTTLLHCLCGYHQPSKGEVIVNGITRNKKEQTKHLIGYVPQDDIVHRTLRVERALTYAYRLRVGEDDKNKIQEKVTEVLDTLDLKDHRKKKVSSLSGGQRKRVSIAMELLHSPSLFFLDEPTAGLDPGLERQLMKFLSKLANKERLIIMTTHLMQTIDAFDVLVFIHKGSMIYCGPSKSIKGFFKVRDMVGLFEKVNAADPKELANRYLSSAIYHKFLSPRLSTSAG